MRTGLCWPTPGPDGAVERGLLARIRDELPLDVIRVNLDHRNPRVAEIIGEIREHGFEPLAILDLDYDALKSWPADDRFGPLLWPYLEFCIDTVTRFGLREVEVLNEPDILHKLDPGLYGAVCNAVGSELKRRALDVTVIAAADMLTAHRKGSRRREWWGEARTWLRPDLYDAVAVHPYRNPGPPDAARPFGTRKNEFDWIRYVAQKPVYVTETGWNLRETSEADHAAYLARELDWCRKGGAVLTALYAHVGTPNGDDWGLFDGRDWRPRPAVQAVRQWIEGHRKDDHHV